MPMAATEWGSIGVSDRSARSQRGCAHTIRGRTADVDNCATVPRRCSNSGAQFCAVVFFFYAVRLCGLPRPHPDRGSLFPAFWLPGREVE